MNIFKYLKLVFFHRKNKVYISGKMTGLLDYGERYFIEAEKNLRKQGYIYIINPFKLSKKLSRKLKKKIENIDYKEFIKFDIHYLTKCNILYMLKNSNDSNGCQIERRVALDCGIYIIYE